MKFSRYLIVVLFSLFTSFNLAFANQSDDCSLDFDQFHSLLKESDAISLNPEQRDFDQKVVTQDATLKNKTQYKQFGKELLEDVNIKFQGGGCSHYAYSLTASNFSAPRVLHRHTVKYIDMISKFVSNSMREPEASILLKALEKQKETTHPKERIPKRNVKVINLDCGPDAQCVLEILNPTKMKISYDFAL